MMKWTACIITVFGMAFYMRIIRRDSCNLLGLYGLDVMDDIWMDVLMDVLACLQGKGFGFATATFVLGFI